MTEGVNHTNQASTARFTSSPPPKNDQTAQTLAKQILPKEIPTPKKSLSDYSFSEIIGLIGEKISKLAASVFKKKEGLQDLKLSPEHISKTVYPTIYTKSAKNRPTQKAIEKTGQKDVQKWAEQNRLKQELADLTAKKELLSTDEGKKQRLEENQTQLQKIHSENLTCQGEIKHAQTMIAHSENEINNSKTDIEVLNDLLKGTEEKTNKEIESKYNDFEKSKTSLKTQIEGYQSAMLETKNTIFDYNTRTSELEQKIEKHKLDELKLTEDQKLAKIARDTILPDIEKFTKEKADLEQQLKDSHFYEFSKKNELEENLNKCEKKLTEAHNKFKEATEKYSSTDIDLHNKIRERTNDHHNLLAIEHEIGQLENLNKSREATIKDLQNKLNTISTEQEIVIAKLNEEQKNSISSIRERINNAERGHEFHIKKLDLSNKDLYKLEVELNDIKTREKSTLDEIDNEGKIIDALHAKIKEIETKLNALS